MEVENTMEDENGADNENIVQNTDTARYGNFVHYYNFHPAENRMRLLPKFLKYYNVNNSGDIVCLDVGCNSGELTCALQNYVEQSFKEEVGDKTVPKCYILAVDLDENLIDKAKQTSQCEHISFYGVDVLSDDFSIVSNSYLKEHNKTIFDIVFCFSVTMWIHLNNGDEALKQFITSLCKITNYLILEPQPWKCYGRAVRRMKRANCEPFEEFSNLRIRRDVETHIDDLIKASGFVKVCQTAPSSWSRLTTIYRRNVLC